MLSLKLSVECKIRANSLKARPKLIQMKLFRGLKCCPSIRGESTELELKRWIGRDYELQDTGCLLVLLISFLESVLLPYLGGINWIIVIRFYWSFRLLLLFLFFLGLLLVILNFDIVSNKLRFYFFYRLYK